MFKDEELLEIKKNLHRFAMRLTHDQADADDLLQATLLRALEKKELFTTGTNLFSWTSKMMYNLFVSQYRIKVRFESQYDPEPLINRMTIPVNQESTCELNTVYGAMHRLSKEHCAILKLVGINGLEYKDAAKALNIPVGTIRSRLSRARRALQVMLDTPTPVLERNAYLMQYKPKAQAQPLRQAA